MTEENAGQGSPGLPGVPAAGPRRVPAQEAPVPVPVERQVPPQPPAPPTSGTPAVPPAPGGSPAPSGQFLAPPAPGPEPDPGSAPGGPASGPAGALTGGGGLPAGKASLRAGWLRRPGLPGIGTGAAAVLVLGVLIWWLVAMFGGGTAPSAGDGPPATMEAPAPPSRGALPLEGVSPLDFRLGDCFKDFDPDATGSMVVACETAHSAQLVALETYAPTDTYPGRELLKQKALDICKGAPLTDKSAGYELGYKLAYPSTNSWGTGDRRVDCFVTAATGNVIMESLLPAP